MAFYSPFLWQFSFFKYKRFLEMLSIVDQFIRSPCTLKKWNILCSALLPFEEKTKKKNNKNKRLSIANKKKLTHDKSTVTKQIYH